MYVFKNNNKIIKCYNNETPICPLIYVVVPKSKNKTIENYGYNKDEYKFTKL